MGESISTILHSPRKSMSYKFAAPRYRLPPMALHADGSGERWTSPFNGDAQSGNGIERSLSRVVVPPSLPVSATTFPTALSVYIAQGACERISAIPASCSQRQNRFHSKRKKNINLVYSSCLKHANEMVLGDPRQAHQRTQSLHFLSSFINHSTIACCSRAQTPSSLSNAWTLDRLRTRRRVGSTRRRGNHMHDHSRFQRDIEWRHRRLSLSLSPSHKSHSRTI